MKATLTLTGTRPLLVKSQRSCNPLEPLVKDVKKLSSKGRSKTDDDLAMISDLEWLLSLYYNDQIGPCLPSNNIVQAIMDGARIYRKGTAVKEGLRALDEWVPIAYEGPRELEKLKKDPAFRDVRAANSNPTSGKPSMVMRTRARFNDWKMRMLLDIDEEIIQSFDELASWAEVAGRRKGLGDYRPYYGTFEAKLKLIEGGDTMTTAELRRLSRTAPNQEENR